MSYVKYHLPIFLIAFLIPVSCNSDPETVSEATEPETEVDTVEIPECTYEPRNQIENPQEIVMIYLTSTSCGLCTNDKLIAYVINIKNEIGDIIREKGYDLMTIGVAINWYVENGYNHLQEYGTFDEIIVGNSWMGTGTLKYLFDDYPGSPTIPQIIFTKRTYDAEPDEDGSIARQMIYGVKEEEVLTRIISDVLIGRFYEGGMEIPGL